jgi:hypothetical protein
MSGTYGLYGGTFSSGGLFPPLLDGGTHDRTIAHPMYSLPSVA